ncbi:non-specific lipid transfer protein GPI-anchored 25-like [Phragmites australis]|uniref:non-specific lipid transfer protein GPI-anchored 25-like n=1 Tax=Phragmites australis TaxID=29695 RepID=UPI002D7670DB|nr:non-specific lipid transfer protein GPI-anchored 25-like [Phragmites australis]
MGPTARRLLLVAVAAAAAALLLLQPAPASAEAASSQDAAVRCVAAIVSLSPCLPHVAAVEARPVPAPTDACCVAFLRAVSPTGGGGGEGCLCHLLREPFLLGFPVDAARLGALLPACAAGNAFAAATVEVSTLFADACRELKVLPELHFTPQSTTRPEISPAAVPESVSTPMEKDPSATPLVRSVAEASGSCGIPLAALILAAAGAVIT